MDFLFFIFSSPPRFTLSAKQEAVPIDWGEGESGRTATLPHAPLPPAGGRAPTCRCRGVRTGAGRRVTAAARAGRGGGRGGAGGARELRNLRRAGGGGGGAQRQSACAARLVPPPPPSPEPSPRSRSAHARCEGGAAAVFCLREVGACGPAQQGALARCPCSPPPPGHSPTRPRRHFVVGAEGCRARAGSGCLVPPHRRHSPGVMGDTASPSPGSSFLHSLRLARHPTQTPASGAGFITSVAVPSATLLNIQGDENTNGSLAANSMPLPYSPDPERSYSIQPSRF